MTKNVNFVSHKKSKQIVDGKPKLPSASALVEGEIAVNYAEDVETLSIKNESGTVVTFSSDNYYTEQKLGSGFTGANSAKTVTEVIEEDERITAAALNDLEERKLDVSAYTPTDLSNYYQKSETSGATELSTAFAGKSDTSHTHASSAVTSMAGYAMAASGTSITTADTLNEAIGKLEKQNDEVVDFIEEKELAIAAALVDLSTNKADKSDLGGLSLVKLTQAQYDALATKDNNTLYVIVG